MYIFLRMDLYKAIHEMRRLSKQGKPFTFTFMSCNLSDRSSQGVVEVHNARLLSRETEQHHRHAEFVERYLNLDTMEARHFYQPLLMTFNGEKVEIYGSEEKTDI